MTNNGVCRVICDENHDCLGQSWPVSALKGSIISMKQMLNSRKYLEGALGILYKL